MKLEFVAKSDIGKARTINQDSFCAYQGNDAGLFVVADGMGGYINGEKASQRIVAELSNWWNSFSPVLFEFEFKKMLLSLEQVIEYANNCIYEELNQNEVCGTTVTVLFIYRNLYGIIYAGDSRCYFQYKRRWGQLTIDEVWENQSSISSRERRMKNHPNRGKLINAIGIKKNIQCRVQTNSILDNTSFLLCTDGLYKHCQDGLIKKSLKKCKGKKSMQKELDRLIDTVYKNGANDNISIIIIKCMDER